MKKKMAVLFILCMVFLYSQALACSALFASDENTVLVGNNEDFSNVLAKVWIHPPENGKLGRIYFGFAGVPHIPMGGMNEKGLFFDCYSTPPLDVKRSRNKPRYPRHLYLTILEECESVGEVMAVLTEFNLEFMRTHQAFFADRYGNWILAEGDVILRGSGGFHVVTNFRQSKVSPQNVTCERYTAAMKMIHGQPEVSVDFVRRAMAVMHIESYPYMGSVLNTLYTNIYNLNRGIIYLYNFHDYANEVVIDLNKEFKKGKHEHELHTLFPESVTTSLYLEETRKRSAREDLGIVIQQGIEQ